MLCLRQHIGGKHFRAVCLVGYNQDFARPADQLNAYLTVYLSLCLCHIGIARPDDFAYGRDAFRAVRHRGDCLGAAHLKYAVNPGNISCCQNDR